MLGALARAFGWSHNDMMAMPVCAIEAYYEHLIRLRALEDVRALDLLAASDNQQHYTMVRERLLAVHERGVDAIDNEGRLVLTPEEHRAELARMRQYLRS